MDKLGKLLLELGELYEKKYQESGMTSEYYDYILEEIKRVESEIMELYLLK